MRLVGGDHSDRVWTLRGLTESSGDDVGGGGGSDRDWTLTESSGDEVGGGGAVTESEP